ncbi:C6 zinc finger domain-containing protein [Colletotrichum incanum]|nr:C6 zinc finger domain-containing protein [Colletotrichum incanum]
MRQTLRRSCAACAKSKHSCDLRTPRCSRCIKRKVLCVYANEPLTAAPAGSGPAPGDGATSPAALDGSGALTNYRFGSFDPFDSYPQTRLPREQVQRLIHSFLHKIAFEYYPLDLSATSNPFLVSWWPLALGDPALFHVSLQTACLDEELLAQRGFQSSEILMADSVALLRRKVEDTSLAIQDGTMNSVITLAAIEFGKGNTQVSDMHVDGVKKLVNMRGGINSVRQTSPLTARMVSWRCIYGPPRVSMIVTGQPQFETQDDTGIGDGVPPPPEWQLDSTTFHETLSELSSVEIDYAVRNVLMRLRNIFQRAQRVPLAPTRLHDLTCFVIHRLLLSTPNGMDPHASVSECIRYGIILYMFIVQGPTYYSHAVIFNTILKRFMDHLKQLQLQSRSKSHIGSSLDVWLLTVGMAASNGSGHYDWLIRRARDVAVATQLTSWDDTLVHNQSLLWLETRHSDDVFRPHWDAIFGRLSHTPFRYSLSPVV